MYNVTIKVQSKQQSFNLNHFNTQSIFVKI